MTTGRGVPEEPEDLTELLSRARQGDAQAAARLLPVIHDQLRRMAHERMRSQHVDHTLQTTALIDEAYLRLFHGSNGVVKNRDHFMALAATTMRSILIDHARHGKRRKRSATGERVVLDDLMLAYEDRSIDLLALDEALQELGRRDPEMVRMIELRFFAGLPVAEVARMLGKSKRAVERDWENARTWLRSRMG